jgi:hypothetical protein
MEVNIPQDLADIAALRAKRQHALEWAGTIAGNLDCDSGVVFKIGRLGLPVEEARRVALEVMGIICESLKIGAGAPRQMRVEVGSLQLTKLQPGYKARTFLPHHDGGHCSYLTPSILDVADFDPRARVFSSEEFNTTHKHKLYQGFFVEHPGSLSSITPYYPWRKMILAAFKRSHDGASMDVASVARWLGKNISVSVARRREHGSRYLSIGGAFGLENPIYHLMPVAAEQDFPPAQYERFPELRRLSSGCKCGRCEGPGARFLCWSFYEALGLSWSEVRAKYETQVTSERHDVVFGHNIIAMHGGLRAGPERVLLPLWLVIDSARGADYERWLMRQWRL